MTGAWYIGVDPASSTAGLAAFDEAGLLLTHEIHVRGQMPDRLVQLRQEARAWLSPLADQGAWCAVVERPSTRHGGATLLASYGVFVEVAASVLSCPVLTLVPTEIDGPAGVAAPTRGVSRKARTMARARTLGYTGDSQDIADAVVCAEAARVLTLGRIARTETHAA